MRSSLLVSLLLLVVMPAASRAAPARDPVDHAQPRAPDGTPVCAAWVHARHTVQGRERSWPTWHPPVDPRYGCAFGHEHGSNPRAFRRFGRTGMPAFGPIGAFASSDEAHAGFKVFVVNEDRKGLSWIAVLHQGSASPRRGTVRFHSLETWLFRGRGLVAHTRVMADFGRAVANCRGAERLARMRLMPSPACESVYERWATTLDVGGVFRARPTFAIDNAITQFDPRDPGRVVFNKTAACGPADPAGWRSSCKGDKRTVLHPRWVARNRGPARFRTDARGRRAGSGLLQVVASRGRVDQRRECCGVENAFVMERPSDGGIYRAGRGVSSTGFEYPGFCVLRTN